MTSLAQETWSEAGHADVCLAYLRAEWSTVPDITVWYDQRLIDEPDLRDPRDNALRRLILGSWREHIVGRIPADTTWWRVRHLRDSHAASLLVIGSDDWRDPGDRNELLKVARRRPGKLRASPKEWDAPILWGHSREGPFTILEGNNRLLGYFGSGSAAPLEIECFVGVSGRPCPWHLPDRAAFGGA